MSEAHESANALLDGWAEIFTRQTEERPGDVFDAVTRQAFLTYLIDTDGLEDTADLFEESPWTGEAWEWAEALRGLASALDELRARTAGCQREASVALLKGLATEQLLREAAFGRHVVGQLLDEEAQA